MKKSFLLTLTCLACVSTALASESDAVRMLATAPLRFEPEANSKGGFVARGNRFRFAFSGNHASIRNDGENISLSFAGANPQAQLHGTNPLRSKSSVFLGNDKSKWRSDVSNYSRLETHGLYRGIDLVYYGNAGELEYDLTVKPRSDPRQIRLRIDGANAHIDGDGNLIAGLIQKRPVAYQMIAGVRIPVDSRYRKNSDGTFGFTLGQYDRGRELVIDPVLTFSTYLAGSEQDVALAVGHDKIGFIYVAGSTYSGSNFPIAGTPWQSTNKGNQDIFVTKLDPNAPSGSEVIWSTFLGGALNETVGGIVVSDNGDVYMTGTTASGDFPTNNSAYATIGSSTTTDAFVCWIDVFQTLVYSTYLGGTGNDSGEGIALDAKGRIWVTGATNSDEFPSVAALQTNRGGQDAFITGFDFTQSGLSTIIYSTFFGGSRSEIGRGIAVAKDGTLWVVGSTTSVDDFPIAAFNFQSTYAGGRDAFVSHVDTTLGAGGLVYSTFLGGSGEEEAKGVVIDAKGRPVVMGYTTSIDFPTTFTGYQPQFGGDTDAFISIIDPSAIGPSLFQLVYSTYFGGVNGDAPFDMKQDAAGNLYISGVTYSPGLPASANALQAAYDQSMDAFVLILNPSQLGLAGLKYFSYLGSDGLQVGYGVDFDNSGRVYMVGQTGGPIFDKLGGAAKGTGPGTVDAFVLGFDPRK
jgi:hypothetical protein